MAEQKYPGTVTVGWPQEGQPRAQMQLKACRRRNCRVCALLRFFLAADGSWVNVDQSYGAGKETAVFSRSHRVFAELMQRSTRMIGPLTRRPDRLI